MKFYVLEPEGGIIFGTKWAYGRPAKPKQYGDCDRCPVCGDCVGMLQWLPPHLLELSSAKPEKWGDFLWGAGFTPLMVSERFKAIYEAEGLTGIMHFYPPAEVVRIGKRKKGDLTPTPPTYRLIKISWNGANQDDAASKVVVKYPEKTVCPFCRVGTGRSKQGGIILEPDTWTGADIFYARGGPGAVLVSERFQQVVETHALKNAWLISAEKYAYDEHRPGGWYVREE